MIKKAFLVFILAVSLSLALGSFCLAQPATSDYFLEIDYPEFGQYRITDTTTLPEYIKYLYHAITGISGLVALGVLVWAGFKYLTSAGNPEKMKDAKERIGAAILGILVLLGSWIIVVRINPELIIIEIEPLNPFVYGLPPGIYLCHEKMNIIEAWDIIEEFKTTDNFDRKQEIKERLQIISYEINNSCLAGMKTAGSIRTKKGIKYVYLVPSIEEGKLPVCYGALLYLKEGFNGNPVPIFPPIRNRPLEWDRSGQPVPDVYSIRTFYLSPAGGQFEGWEVVLYQYENYRDEGPASKISFGPGDIPANIYSVKFYLPDIISFAPRSIEIAGNAIACLGDSSQVKEKGCVIFLYNAGDHPNLIEFDEITKEKCTGFWLWRECEKIYTADTLWITLAEQFW